MFVDFYVFHAILGVFNTNFINFDSILTKYCHNFYIFIVVLWTINYANVIFHYFRILYYVFITIDEYFVFLQYFYNVFV